jgi:photosystem II stability/assembly factor-like uncharacterized protein
VRPNFFLLFLALALSMVACDIRTSTVMPASPVPTNGSVSAITFPTPSPADTPFSPTTQLPIPPALPVVASPVLVRIDFQDENNGWGIAVNDEGYIVRTIDGGRTWFNATPLETGGIGYSANLVILNSSTVWMLVPGTDYFSGTLFRTSDGGVTWNSNPVPFGGGFLQFLDASTGRAMADRGARAGSEAVEIFQSSDGGVTWVSAFHNDTNQPGSSDSLPLDGIKNGMTFLDANTGWVTGSIPKDGDVYLYVTRDGGVTWTEQSLPLPADYTAYQYIPRAPVFFGKDGFLPLIIHLPSRTDLTFYTTHDGGLTWSGDPTDGNKVIKPGLPAFADAMHIWSWDGGTNLFLSTDGSQSWKSTLATLDLSGRLARLEFVSASVGRFTGWALTHVDDSGHSQLYRSSDGSLWTAIIP